MDHNEFAKKITVLYETLKPGKPLPEGLIETYWQALKDVPTENLRIAFELAFRRDKFMPKPSELREYASVQDMTLRAQAAHILVTSAMRRYGAYQSVTFDSAINATIAALGGWQEVCGTDREIWHGYRKRDFINIYTHNVGIQMGGGQIEAPDKLIGIIEAKNVAKGITPPKAICITMPAALLELPEGGK